VVKTGIFKIKPNNENELRYSSVLKGSRVFYTIIVKCVL